MLYVYTPRGLELEAFWRRERSGSCQPKPEHSGAEGPEQIESRAGKLRPENSKTCVHMDPSRVRMLEAVRNVKRPRAETER